MVVFLLTFTNAFAKWYYQAVVTNVLTNCKSDECRKKIFEQEARIAFFALMEAINQVRFEISQSK